MTAQERALAVAGGVLGGVIFAPFATAFAVIVDSWLRARLSHERQQAA